MPTRTVLMDPWLWAHLNQTLPPGHPFGSYFPGQFGWGIEHSSTSQEGAVTGARQYGNPSLGEQFGNVYGPAWAALPYDAVGAYTPGPPMGGVCLPDHRPSQRGPGRNLIPLRRCRW